DPPTGKPLGITKTYFHQQVAAERYRHNRSLLQTQFAKLFGDSLTIVLQIYLNISFNAEICYLITYVILRIPLHIRRVDYIDSLLPIDDLLYGTRIPSTNPVRRIRVASSRCI